LGVLGSEDEGEVLKGALLRPKQVMLTLAGTAWAESTKKGYSVEWDRFTKWCVDKNRTFLPASPLTVALYLAARFDEGGESSGGKITAVITLMHEAAGLVSPVGSKIITWVKKGMNKCRKRLKKSDLFDLSWLLEWRKSGKSKVSEYRWLRNSVVVALGIRTIQRPKDLSLLNVGHLSFTSDGFLWVLFPSSKTDQVGAGHLIPIDPTGDLDLCVVALVKEYLAFLGDRGKDFPLFGKESDWGARLGASGVSAAVVQVVRHAGVWDKCVTGRSLRVTGANLGANAGVPREVLKTVANWRSDAIDQYYRSTASRTLEISKKMGFLKPVDDSLI
jgi:hypothetical protein